MIATNKDKCDLDEPIDSMTAMALIKTILSRLKKFFIVLFAILKKPFCCRRRSRRNSDHILPITVDKSVTSGHSFNTFHTSNSMPNSRNNWPLSHNPNQSTDNSYNSHISVNSNTNVSHSVDDNSLEPEVDFFKDMVPEFKKPKKVGSVLCFDIQTQTLSNV